MTGEIACGTRTGCDSADTQGGRDDAVRSVATLLQDVDRDLRALCDFLQSIASEYGEVRPVHC